MPRESEGAEFGSSAMLRAASDASGLAPIGALYPRYVRLR
jgi:hypothetical protein